MADIYACHACGCVYGYPTSTTPVTRASTREVLLQLSRTLNSVIDGDAVVTLEDILRDISRIVPVGMTGNMRNDTNLAYEYFCPSWTLGDRQKNLPVSPSYVKHVPSRTTAVNPKLYVAPRYFYGYNSVRSMPLLKSGGRKTTRREKNNRESSSSLAEQESRDTADPHVRKYLREKHDESDDCAKQSFGPDGDSKRCRNGRASLYPTVSTLALASKLTFLSSVNLSRSNGDSCPILSGN